MGGGGGGGGWGWVVDPLFESMFRMALEVYILIKLQRHMTFYEESEH